MWKRIIDDKKNRINTVYLARPPFRPSGSDEIAEIPNLLLDCLAIEEYNAIQSLILRSGGQPTVDGQVTEEGIDFGSAHLPTECASGDRPAKLLRFQQTWASRLGLSLDP